jgi:hypothetical protein
MLGSTPPLTKLKEFQGIYTTGTEGLVVKGPGLPPTNIFRSLTSNPSLDDVLPKVEIDPENKS